MLNDADRPVQFVFAGKAHPADTPGQGADPEGRAVRPQGRRPPPLRVPRRLRHGDRPGDVPRLRRLAEHAAPSARGVRHERDEGGPQRGAELLDPRRLVGRVLRARASAGRSSRRRTIRTSNGATSGSAPASSPCSRSRSSPTFYEYTSGGLPADGSRWSRRRGRRSDRTSPRHGWCATTPPTCTNRRPRRHSDLTVNNGSLAAELAAWRRHVQASWPSVSITSLDVDTSAADTGVSRPVTVTVAMDGLDPGDLRVDVLHGTVGPDGEFDPEPATVTLAADRRRHLPRRARAHRPRLVRRHRQGHPGPPGAGLALRARPRHLGQLTDPPESFWAACGPFPVLGGLRSENLSFGRPDRPPGCPNVGP